MLTKPDTCELGGAVITQEWMELFEHRPYDALLGVPKSLFTPEFVHALVTKPYLYQEGYSKTLGKWCNVNYTISMLPIDMISDDDILTMCGVDDEYIGNFGVVKNENIRKRITTDMAVKIFVASLDRDAYSPMSTQRMPKCLITDDFIQTVLPDYSYQLLSVLPKEKKTPDVYLAAIGFNPACYGRTPADMRTDDMAESCFKGALGKSDITDHMLRSMLKAVPDLMAIDFSVLEQLVTERPTLLKTLLTMAPKLNADKLLRAACNNPDDKELRKAIDAVPVDVLRLYLTAGFHTLKGVGNLC